MGHKPTYDFIWLNNDNIPIELKMPYEGNAKAGIVTYPQVRNMIGNAVKSELNNHNFKKRTS